MKTGVDAATQVEDGELFDFDAEVEPILEVLVGKTLEQVRSPATSPQSPLCCSQRALTRQFLPDAWRRGTAVANGRC